MLKAFVSIEFPFHFDVVNPNLFFLFGDSITKYQMRPSGGHIGRISCQAFAQSFTIEQNVDQPVQVMDMVETTF